MKKWHILILIAGIGLDQFTKYLVDAKMHLFDSIEIIAGFFRITYTHNTGAAWSMLEGKMIFFYLIAVIALVAMIYFYLTMKQDRFLQFALVLMMAGTLGNLIDRIVFQYVRDFLDFVIIGYDFPIFNIADMLLCIGVGLILLQAVYEELVKYGIVKGK